MRNEIHAPTKLLVDSKQSKKNFWKFFFPSQYYLHICCVLPFINLVFSVWQKLEKKSKSSSGRIILVFYFIFWYLIILIGLSWKWRKISVKNKLQFRIFFIAFVLIVIFVLVLCIQKMSSGSVRRVSCQDIQVVSFSDWIFFFHKKIVMLISKK